MQTLDQWLAHIEAMHPRGVAGIELGLDRVKVVSEQLGQHVALSALAAPIITVAGTNGKGSVVAYLSNMLDRAGYKVGTYTSPHLIHFNERIRLNGQVASDAALLLAFEQVEAARLAVGLSLTYFEFTTLAAMQVFLAAGVQVVVLEVGLGGRLDAVNLYEPDVSVVTGVA
ncbi:MAG: bifunctional folylpolyglutamate synthase/dihydrofolate synthase, partial [Rhodocyclaceae bacterium]|nr:bifunctional folylpolyglutamate synthase/dihydrofolate synthase [Rhodocyclaceae bacterium]